MDGIQESTDTAAGLAAALRAFLNAESDRTGGPVPAINPGHRIPFHWPPHPVSHSFHIHPTEWRTKAQVEFHGEKFEVLAARTPFGTFGRVEELWLEARGANREEMLANLAAAAEPLFARQLQVAACIGREGRFTGHVRDLSNRELLILLFCPNRDVSHEAATVIELRASTGLFFPSLMVVLNNRSHPLRRAAQWAVLNLLEDFGGFCRNDDDEREAVAAIRNLIWNAEDDFARTIYKAGVVLGGHMPASTGGEGLLECLKAPSPIGRRSAYHGLFHVVEWEPSTRERVVSAILAAAEVEPIPVLREYAMRMAQDIEKGAFDHVSEPTLEGE